MKTIKKLKNQGILYVNKQQDNYLQSLASSKIIRHIGSWTGQVFYTYNSSKK